MKAVITLENTIAAGIKSDQCAAIPAIAKV
jgi:hypothetical protein